MYSARQTFRAYNLLYVCKCLFDGPMKSISAKLLALAVLATVSFGQKAERKRELLQRGTVVRTYKVALGLNPVGTKERSGDFRTPEGAYRLVRRNPRSDFFLSMQVSYPNDRDLK